MNRDRKGSGLLLGAALALVCSGPALAAPTPISGKIHIIKDAKLVKMVSKGPFPPLPTPAGAADPTVVGATLDVFDTGSGNAFSTALPAAGWQGLGNPAGSKGYKYKGAGSGGDPCKVVIIKETVLKYVCKDDQTLDPPLVGTSGTVLALGPDGYCAEFGGTDTKNVAGLVKRKDAPAPAVCPTPGSGGSTTTFPPGPCCNDAGFHSFGTTPGSGTCGSFTNASGMSFALSCNGLYFGGGQNAVPLPALVPDMVQSITSITSCTGQTATLGAATSAQTGTNRTCTEPGCFFGAPLAVPNSTSTPTSTCILNRIGGAVNGMLDCGTGAETLDLPLGSIAYLTGDQNTDAVGTIPGIQPCPLCSSSTCIGGPNNGMSCTPGTSALNAAYPTSQDCPPTPGLSIGTLPIAFTLATGTVSWTGTPATNPASGIQTLVFSGFCRDPASAGFPFPPQKCWENGMAVGAACSGTFSTCQQRDEGAFGPNGGSVKTITEVGTPQTGILGGTVPTTLVSVFSIPQTLDPTVNAAGDLPGPGAVSLPGTASLCADAMVCP